MPITYRDDMAWPPGDPRLGELFCEYGIWYKGDSRELANYYRNSTYGGLDVRPSQRSGGVVGFLARLFWGQPNVGTIGDMERVHIPAAADISALSADLLYSEQPRITLDGPTTATDRLQEILTEGGCYAVFAQAAELASAYGSSYFRVSVDTEAADHPIPEALTPHCALPEWRYGRLIAVTFWHTLKDPRNGVVRHLERHERGMVQHQLRLGSATQLGAVADLRSHEETRRFADLARTAGNDQGIIPTGIDMLDVVHQANILPNRELPDEPIGRSDYQGGGIDAMQGLDETWSRWMDELRRAAHRIIVPAAYTRGLGPGKGSTFDLDQRVFTAVEALDPSQPLQITMTDFNIRVDEYERTAAGQWRTIVRHAGLSADAFGEESSGAQATATEVGQRGARTIATRERKVDYAAQSTRQVSRIITAYDALYFAGKGSEQGARVSVSFPDGVTADPMKDAQTVQYLDAAGAASLRTKIAMAHKDWDKDEIEKEAKAIEGEKEAIVVSAPTDPGQFDTPADTLPPDESAVPSPPMNGNRVAAGY